MVYLDTSVALAQLLAEDRRPAPTLWDASLVSSRLLSFELLTAVNNRRSSSDVVAAARGMIARIALLELIPEIVERANEAFPIPVRSLDALHLASVSFLIAQGVDVLLATYDARMRSAAERLEIPLAPI